MLLLEDTCIESYTTLVFFHTLELRGGGLRQCLENNI
jgi:hypothetical protein